MLLKWLKWLFTPDYGAPDSRPDNPPSAETPMRRGGGQPRPKTPSGVRQRYEKPVGAQERVVPPPVAHDGRRPPGIAALIEQDRQREPVATGSVITVACSGCYKAMRIPLRLTWGKVYCWDCVHEGKVECAGCHRLLSVNLFAQASPMYCYDCRQEG